MSNTNSNQAPGQNKTSTVIVNGRPREVTAKTVSYEEIVKLAFPDEPSNQDIDFTVRLCQPPRARRHAGRRAGNPCERRDGVQCHQDQSFLIPTSSPFRTRG